MDDLYSWSARDPRWARLSTILSQAQIKLDAHSNGAFDEFVRSRPAEERQEWHDLFAAYATGQKPAASDEPFVIARDRPDPLGRTVRRIHVETPSGTAAIPAPAPIVSGQPRSYGAVPVLGQHADPPSPETVR